MFSTKLQRMGDLARDRIFNLSSRPKDGYILIIRDLYFNSDYNTRFLRWLRAEHPADSRHIVLGRWSHTKVITTDCKLVVNWVQDPVKERDINAYNHLKKIESRCSELNIPVINPADILSHSIKSYALTRLKEAGYTTAKCFRIEDTNAFDPAGRLDHPFFIREDAIHSHTLEFIRSPDDLKHIDLTKFASPLAMEFINTQSPDGLYRKYRAIVAGNDSRPYHLLIGTDWFLKASGRMINDANIKEETAYTSLDKDPNHDALIRAREILEFDTVAFDYSYTGDGQMVIWEPNPFPFFFQRTELLEHQRAPLFRTFEMLLAYYLSRAGLLT